MPEPTVIVRMKENEQASPLGGGVGVHVIALGDVSVARREITMTHTRYAFIKANWHAEIVGQSLVGFLQIIPAQQVDVFNVPGAFELPLVARSGKIRQVCRRGRGCSGLMIGNRREALAA
jgi:6,7-dimethyl-8-ribityllumazine synthase